MKAGNWLWSGMQNQHAASEGASEEMRDNKARLWEPRRPLSVDSHSAVINSKRNNGGNEQRASRVSSAGCLSLVSLRVQTVSNSKHHFHQRWPGHGNASNTLHITHCFSREAHKQDTGHKTFLCFFFFYLFSHWLLRRKVCFFFPDFFSPVSPPSFCTQSWRREGSESEARRRRNSCELGYWENKSETSSSRNRKWLLIRFGWGALCQSTRYWFPLFNKVSKASWGRGRTTVLFKLIYVGKKNVTSGCCLDRKFYFVQIWSFKRIKNWLF